LLASREDSLRASIICETVRACWVGPSRHDVSRFRCALRCSCFAVPHWLLQWVHPHTLRVSFRVQNLVLLTACLAAHRLRTSRGAFVPLRDVNSRCPLLTNCFRHHIVRPRTFPGPLRSALDVSHVLDGLRHHESCEFISPRSHVQDFSSGSFPLGQPHELVARRCPLDVCVHPLPLLLQASAPRIDVRLQGFAPTEDPLQEHEWLTHATARYPPEFRLLRVFLHEP